MLFVSCEEDVEGGGTQSGGPAENVVSGFITDYFYDLDNDAIDAQFLYYRKAEGGYSNTIADTSKIDVTKDTINFRTYNEFRLKVPEAEIEIYNQYTHFDETNGGECESEGVSCIDIDYRVSQGEHYVIDNFSVPVLEDDGSEDGIDDEWEGFSITLDGCIDPSNDGKDNNDDDTIDNEQGSPYACEDLEQSGEYEIFSHQFTSIEKIIWDIEGSRYKTYLDTTFIHYEDPSDPNSDFTQSQWEYSSVDVELGVDTPIYNYDSLIYMTNINDFLSPDTGIFYLDTLEFIKTNFLYTSEDIEIFQEFTFNDMQTLSQDSSMYRIITDCNQDGELDLAEPMNYDYNSDGDMLDILNEAELNEHYCGDNGAIELDDEKNDICYEFSDLSNGVLDGGELYYDLNNNDKYDSYSEFGAEPFEDRNCNGVYDCSEFFDYNNDGDYDDILEEQEFCDASIGDSDICSSANEEECDDTDGCSDSQYENQSDCESAGTCSDSQYDNNEDECTAASEVWTSAGNIWTICFWNILDYCGGGCGLPDGDGEDTCIEWVDSGNGIWDDAEEDDGSGLGSKVTSVPSSILFDHSENPPSPVIEIDEFTEIEAANGNLYKVIDIITILDSVYQYVPKVDSVVTIFSNEVITHFAPDSSKDLDYVITKTRSAYPDPVREGFDVSEYNYNIFNTENHIKELKNPSFFLPYGFYETPEAISDGFWFDVCRDTLDIFLYAPDGQIYSGEDIFYIDTLIVNEDSDCDGDGISDNAGNGDYNIEIDYDVEHLDSVMTKTRKVLTDEDGLCLGSLMHIGIEPLYVSDPADCYKVPTEGGIGAAALDTMVYDCFKITKTLTMTYIGSGVEYGEKVTMWLAKDLGIVKNYLDIRWSEPIWVDEEQWKPYSRWELVQLRDDAGGNDLGRFMGKRRVSYDDFKNLIEFDSEPFERRRTAGLHRVRINH